MVQLCPSGHQFSGCSQGSTKSMQRAKCLFRCKAQGLRFKAFGLLGFIGSRGKNGGVDSCYYSCSCSVQAFRDFRDFRLEAIRRLAHGL